MRVLQSSLTAITLTVLAACGIDSTTTTVKIPATSAQTTTTNYLAAKYVPDATDLSSKIIPANFFSVVIIDDQKIYDHFEYKTTDNKVTTRGIFDLPITLSFRTEGEHSITVTGVKANGWKSPAKTIRFIINSLPRVADGEYTGDYMEYTSSNGTTTTFTNARVGAAVFSGTRTNDNITGTISFDDVIFNIAGNLGASVDNSKPPADVELQLDGNSRSIRVYSYNNTNYNYLQNGFYYNYTLGGSNYTYTLGGYYHYMNLDYAEANTAVRGNLKLYRTGSGSIGKLLQAECASMKMSTKLSQNEIPPAHIEARIMLYSFDDKDFYGHIRLIHLNPDPAFQKVLSYDIQGKTGNYPLSLGNNSIQLTLIKPFGSLLKTNPPVATGIGYITVDKDDNNNYKISQWSLILANYAIYDADTTIYTAKTYPATQ